MEWWFWHDAARAFYRGGYQGRFTRVLRNAANAGRALADMVCATKPDAYLWRLDSSKTGKSYTLTFYCFVEKP
jgi:hypothetical protein